MASPYAGLTEEQLVEHLTFYRKVLTGKLLQSTSIQGASSSRKIPTLAEARVELQLVLKELRRLDPDTYGGVAYTRTYFGAA